MLQEKGFDKEAPFTNFLISAAERCNDKKEKSRAAQEASDELYLNLLIRSLFEKDIPLSGQAVVTELGPNSFTVLLPQYGITKRVHVEEDFKWTITRVNREHGKDIVNELTLRTKEGQIVTLDFLTIINVELVPRAVKKLQKMEYIVVPAKDLP